MSNVVEQINEIMEKIHLLHKQYDSEEKVYDIIYDELDNEETESYHLFQQAQRLIAQNRQDGLAYFEQCSILDFGIFAWKAMEDYFDAEFYRAIELIWNRRAPKKPRWVKQDVEDAINEALMHFE